MSIVLTEPLRWSVSPWRMLSGWLSRAPIDDPVDRRNAPMLQILLLLLASLPPLMWAYRGLATDIPWRPGETISLAISLGISVFVLFDLWLVRRGRFQGAVRLLMVVIAIAMLLAYFGSGFGANRYEQPIQAVWLIVTGLVIGRRALWLMYGWMVLAFAAGGVVDFGSAKNVGPALDLIVDCSIAALIFLFIAIVVDRTVTALRESLQAATRRADELVQVNERLQAEISERERMQEQLIHSQKVEAVGRLASGVAHDFNHLLGLVLGYTARGKRADTDDEVQKALTGVESAARRATAVAQKLLSFSRQEVTRTETFDVGVALREMQMMLRQLFDPAVEIVLDLPERPAAIHFDRAQFELVILNLAANAEHAMPEGGRFRIVVKQMHDTPAVVIDLHDTGHGMSEDVRARIFEPFFTTKPSGQGTGLGLAVTRDLIVSAGGSIEVDSSPAAGAAFRIRLPVPAAVDPELAG